MKKYSRKGKYTVEELVKIYDLNKKKGYTHRKIAKLTNVTSKDAVQMIIYRLKQVMSGQKIAGYNIGSNYEKAVNEIINSQTASSSEINERPTNNNITDPYSKLQESFISLQKAIEAIIELEVDKRVKEERKLAKQLLDEAKKSNWIDNLRQKFSQV